MYSKKINQLATNLNPQPTDLLPIGDSETGQLKTTTFGSVSGITGDGVISGGIVTWTGTGLIFNISACTYILNGIRYSSPFSTKTLAAADPTNARIDVFAVNTSGQVEVIQGTPNANPVEPEGDTATTLGLTNVTINAGATTPNNVTRTIVYDENLSSPTEWTRTFTQSASSVDYNNTTSPNTGSKCILVTQGAGFINLNFTNATTLDISNFKSLSFAIRLTNALTSNTILSVRFLNGSNVVSNTFQIGATNNVGFNRNLAGAYQIITIPFNNTNLRFTSNAFTTIRIATQNAAATYRLDTISLNGGINNPGGGTTTPSNSFGFVNGTTGTASATTATDTLNVVGSGLITTSATGKTLTIASNQIATGSILGRVTASTGNIETLTGTQATTLLDVFTSSLKGLVPASGGGTTNFLRADGTWAAAGGGTTIYTGNGTLSSARTLTHGGFNLDFIGSTYTNRFTSAGRLLLGTTTDASYNLYAVSGGVTSYFRGGNGGYAAIAFTGDNNATIGVLTSYANTIIIGRANGAFGTNFGANFDILIYSNGDVQIGTDTQRAYKLHVKGGANVTSLNIANTSAQLLYSNISGLALVGTTGSSFNIGLLETTGNKGLFVDASGFIKVGVYTDTFNSSAILEAVSTTKGFLPPRMTTTQKNAISSPAAGLIVYDTTDNKHYGYNGTTWNAFF